MPSVRWLLIAVPLSPLPLLANDLTSWVSLLPMTMLLLLVVALVFYSWKLHQRGRQLSDQQQLLQGLLQHSDDIIAILDHNLQPSYINPALASSSMLAGHHATDSLPLYVDQQGSQPLLPLPDLQANWSGEAWLQISEQKDRLALAVSITRLDNAAQRYMLIGRNINTLKQLQQQTQDAYMRDSQTGLLNSALLSDYLKTFITLCSPQYPNFALILLKFNQLISPDTAKPQGNLQDKIPALSSALQQLIGNGYVLARHDNDTFALIVPPHLCDGQFEVKLNRLAHKLQEIPKLLAPSEKKVALQTIISISVYPLDGQQPAELLFAATTALQNASRLGHNHLMFANSRIQQRTPEYLTLETELRKALVQGEFDVYYQPRVSISSNRVIGYEALLRWHSPKRGILLPQHFLSLADETGMLIELEQLTFKKCCEQLQYWLKTGINRGRISLNVSSLSFHQADFAARLTTELERTGLSADQFELELHEDILLHPTPDTAASLQQLTTIGFHLTLDNFGAGVSSLSALRRFPLHNLKIAPGFIKDMEHNEQQRNITASLIRLASYLQLDVIATGIENEMQAYLLHVMGCDILQGHLFSKALPATEIPALLAKENKLLRKEVS